MQIEIILCFSFFILMSCSSPNTQTVNKTNEKIFQDDSTLKVNDTINITDTSKIISGRLFGGQDTYKLQKQWKNDGSPFVFKIFIKSNNKWYLQLLDTVYQAIYRCDTLVDIDGDNANEFVIGLTSVTGNYQQYNDKVYAYDKTQRSITRLSVLDTLYNLSYYPSENIFYSFENWEENFIGKKFKWNDFNSIILFEMITVTKNKNMPSKSLIKKYSFQNGKFNLIKCVKGTWEIPNEYRQILE